LERPAATSSLRREKTRPPYLPRTAAGCIGKASAPLPSISVSTRLVSAARPIRECTRASLFARADCFGLAPPLLRIWAADCTRLTVKAHPGTADRRLYHAVRHRAPGRSSDIRSPPRRFRGAGAGRLGSSPRRGPSDQRQRGGPPRREPPTGAASQLGRVRLRRRGPPHLVTRTIGATNGDVHRDIKPGDIGLAKMGATPTPRSDSRC